MPSTSTTWRTPCPAADIGSSSSITLLGPTLSLVPLHRWGGRGGSELLPQSCRVRTGLGPQVDMIPKHRLLIPAVLSGFVWAGPVPAVWCWRGATSLTPRPPSCVRFLWSPDSSTDSHPGFCLLSAGSTGSRAGPCPGPARFLLGTCRGGQSHVVVIIIAAADKAAVRPAERLSLQTETLISAGWVLNCGGD